MLDRNIETAQITMPRHDLEQELRSQISDLKIQLAEKQLLLQGRSAEIEQNRSEIASLRKRVRELESVRPQSSVSSAPDAESTQAGRVTTVARFETEQKEKMHEERKSFDNGPGRSLFATTHHSENRSPEFRDARDDDFVLGEPRITDGQEKNFARLEARVDTMKAETEGKSSKIFGTRRWRIRGQKRRWKILNGKEADSKSQP